MTPIYFRVHKFNVSFQTSSPFDEHLAVVYDVNELPRIPFMQVLHTIDSSSSTKVVKQECIKKLNWLG